MSQYGPPGGPYPGQPQDPWQGGQQPQDSNPYGPPADPYGPGRGGQDGWGGSPSSAPPGSPGPYGAGQQTGYGQPAYDNQQQTGYNPATGYGQTNAMPAQDPFGPPQQPAFGQGEPWGPPQAPPKKKSGALIAVAVVLAVLVIGGGGAAAYVLTSDNGDDKKTEAGATGNPTTGPTGPTAAATPSGKTSANPSGSAISVGDARNAKVGDCLSNAGTTEKPQLVKASCGPNTFQVLKRVDGTIDPKKCEGTPGFTQYYYFKANSELFNFILCLKVN
jgi:hypothetical protein